MIMLVGDITYYSQILICILKMNERTVRLQLLFVILETFLDCIWLHKVTLASR